MKSLTKKNHRVNLPKRRNQREKTKKVKTKAKLKVMKKPNEFHMKLKLNKKKKLEAKFREGIIFTKFSILTVKQTNKQQTQRISLRLISI